VRARRGFISVAKFGGSDLGCGGWAFGKCAAQVRIYPSGGGILRTQRPHGRLEAWGIGNSICAFARRPFTHDRFQFLWRIGFVAVRG
jgi:hypothetical protein